jgi:diguanylate cyclase (GGDEF)-like protein
VPLPKLRVAPKFFLVLGVVVPAIAAMAWIGLHGLAGLRSDINHIYDDNLLTTQVTSRLATELHHAGGLSLELLIANEKGRKGQLDHALQVSVMPHVQAELGKLRQLHAHDPAPERRRVAFIASQWDRFLTLEASGALQAAGHGSGFARRNQALATRLAQIFARATGAADQMVAMEADRARRAAENADDTYARSRSLIIGLGAAILLAVAGVVLTLIRNVVPRVRAYSRFASAVASGELGRRLDPKGHDELTELGATLNHLVDRRTAERGKERAQTEFAQCLQVVESEEEAHDLLKRHIERSIAGSSAIVLNRNNSADRLVATTPVPVDSELASALVDAKPASCMAVRLGASHDTEPGQERLLTCALCGKIDQPTTCEPLLVGGEVIGSVLIEHPGPLASTDANQVKHSVAQAAPVLANLRNLAIAEMRASTDALTGLPNRRAADDTLKRMAAHASRTMEPLSAILFDLDNFKQINDVFGHARGDEVLAAVGSVLEGHVRASDFAARSGGEEFLILLPSTSSDGARIAAEKVRLAIAEIKIPDVNRLVTASLGVAVIPDHATDGHGLLRNADRAMYEAKARGRNRVVVFARSVDGAQPVRAASAVAGGADP